MPRPPANRPTVENATRLAVVRYERELTLKQVAAAAGIAVGYLHDLEFARKRPGLDVARRLAKALGTTVDDIFPEDGP